MISASAKSRAVSTSYAYSSGYAINNSTGETATSTATATASASATATATATSDSFESAMNNAIQIATNTALNIASDIALNIVNNIANNVALIDVLHENPLYPLTILEQTNISNYFLNNILQGQNVPNDIFIDLVVLKEPIKSDILLFQNTGVLPVRKAEVGIYNISNDVYNLYEVILNSDQDVESVSEPNILPRSRGTYNTPENNKILQIVMESPECRQALLNKGLSDYDIDNNLYFDEALDSRLDLINELYGPNFSDFIYKTTPRPRVWYLTPFWRDGPNTTDVSRSYIQPIDSLIFFVNSRNNTILKIYDAGNNVPIQKGNTDWERPLAPNLNPIITTLPNGPSYTITNNIVEWADWKYTWSVHPVNALLLYNISFLDRTVWKEDHNLDPVRRSILYKANLGEVITCYGDNSISGSVRNFFDFGEYNTRDFSVEIIPGIDVPSYATFFDYNFTNPDGTILNLPNRVGFYERDAGMLWRHTGYSVDGSIAIDGRSARELVVTFINTISNYDYVFNWIFTQDGDIRFEMIPSGVIETDSINLIQSNEDMNGSLILPYVYGLNHSHLANVRLDFSIDGSLNKIEETDTVHMEVSETNPYGNLFIEKNTLLETELNAIRDTDFTKSRKWVVHNEFSKNYLGYERGYELSPYPTTFPFNADERIIKRASYMKHSLHVTKYHDGELYSVGQFPVEDSEDRGLAVYIENDEPIVNEDIVVWYTFGFSHNPRIEDTPVMPREPLGFKLSAHNFFNENPGLYIPKTML